MTLKIGVKFACWRIFKDNSRKSLSISFEFAQSKHRRGWILMELILNGRFVCVESKKPFKNSGNKNWWWSQYSLRIGQDTKMLDCLIKWSCIVDNFCINIIIRQPGIPQLVVVLAIQDLGISCFDILTSKHSGSAFIFYINESNNRFKLKSIDVRQLYAQDMRKIAYPSNV